MKVDLTCERCKDKGTYDMPVFCSNCGLRGTATYSRGHEAIVDRCPNCDTRNLRVKRLPI